jgi:hypothetical protein
MRNYIWCAWLVMPGAATCSAATSATCLHAVHGKDDGVNVARSGWSIVY